MGCCQGAVRHPLRGPLRHHLTNAVPHTEFLTDPRRRAENQSGKRKCVVVIRQRDRLTLPNAFASEAAALSFIKARVAAKTEIHADEAPS